MKEILVVRDDRNYLEQTNAAKNDNISGATLRSVLESMRTYTLRSFRDPHGITA